MKIHDAVKFLLERVVANDAGVERRAKQLIQEIGEEFAKFEARTEYKIADISADNLDAPRPEEPAVTINADSAEQFADITEAAPAPAV